MTAPRLDPSQVDALVRDAVDRALRARTRRLVSVASLLAAALVVTVAVRALAVGTCAQTLPAPLVTFCPDEPALAAEVNSNFNALALTLQTRTGSLTDGGVGITTPNVTISTSGRRGFFDGTDLVLDTTARRSGAGGVSRRALVHETNDVLVMNYGSDYTGGVLINGPVSVTGVVNQGCPAAYPIGGGAVTMVDMGVYCITQSAPTGMGRNQVSWIEANEFCVSKGLRLCSFGEVSAAARLNRITTYPYASGTRDTWAWVDQTATDNNNAGFGGCHVKLNPDHPGYSLGEINCAVDGFARQGSIEGACCY